MAILEIKSGYGRPATHIVVEPSEQSEGYDPDTQAALSEEQGKIVNRLDEHIPSRAELEKEAKLNQIPH